MAAAMAALSACAVGPDFRGTEAPEVQRYTPLPLPEATDAAAAPQGEAQRFVNGGEIPSQWWTLFASHKLELVIRQALAQSPNLAAAEAALRRAEEIRGAEAGSRLPDLDAGLSVERRKFTGASFGQPGGPGGIFTLYNASVSVSYGLDPFGLVRRRVESFQAQLDYQRFLLQGARLTLASNIVTTVIQECSLRERIEASAAIIAAEEEQLRLVKLRMDLGGAVRSEFLAQQAQLAQTRTTIPPLEKELALTRHRLAVLAGLPPSQAAALPEFELEGLKLPPELPVSLPSELVRQRPDILASEELLHQAGAEVGVATANLFPRLTITGDFGSQGPAPADLFSAGTGVWSIGAGLVQPLFRGGELGARRRAALAAYAQAEALYRETVLMALQNVADVLRSLELDARALKAQAEAEAAARGSLEVALTRYRLGAVNHLTLLDAQRQHQQARISLAQARAMRLADTAALFQALGGGWWSPPTGAQPPASPEVGREKGFRP